MTTKKSSWELLSKIDVSQHVEKKNNLTYLSWAWAWGILKNEYPNATFTKHHSPQTGMPYFVDHNGFCLFGLRLSWERVSLLSLSSCQFLTIAIRRSRTQTASQLTTHCSVA